MKVTIALLVYVALVGTAGAAWLRRWKGPQARPQLGLALWIALDMSIVLSIVLAAMAPVVGLQPVQDGLMSVVSACVLSLTQRYTGSGDATAHLMVAILGWGALLGITALGASVVVRAARFRRRHREGVALLGQYRPELGAWVINHAKPLVYCVGGRRRGVVLTTGAIVALDPDELSAVLAHERAHLRQRHMQLVILADGLRCGLGWIPGVRAASDEIAELVELCADDAARQATDGRTVASALLTLAAGPMPLGALGASTGVTRARLSRLLDPPAAPRQPVVAVSGAILSSLAVPVAIAVLPAVLGVNADYCPAEGYLTAQAIRPVHFDDADASDSARGTAFAGRQV